jgi:hypothetical protein
MKTVIKNSAQVPCLPLSLTPRFSEVHQSQRLLFPLPVRLGEGWGEGFIGCGEGWVRGRLPSLPGHPTKSEHIRPNPSNFSFRLPQPRRPNGK